ncbi:metallophosphoesterase [Thioalkalicoccus limnaeus]|uniref:Metallophosphoesterase n=1 Tax=Thioalkalicoccus limnaeus TaxID=120681 RepID=A0ABV4BFS0_9GAMM
MSLGQPTTGSRAIPVPSTGGLALLRVVQVTDTHLLADPNGGLLGLCTRTAFESVLDLMLSRFGLPDILLLSGDLVHDESLAGYRYLAGRLRALGVPFYAIPGNHDDADRMAAVLDADAASPMRALEIGGWQWLLLDSAVSGCAGGRLDPGQVGALDEALSRCALPALIGLHHHPVPVGSRWLDDIGLANGSELMALIERHRHVKAVLWGHVHQEFRGRQGDCLLLGSPSTCVQFAPGTERFALDRSSPGFRWLVLYADGRIETGVERLPGRPDSLNLAAPGY